ncbi:MAG: hypothetical protein ACRD1T_23505, partial [Acidimicrobiia bacterium]
MRPLIIIAPVVALTFVAAGVLQEASVPARRDLTPQEENRLRSQPQGEWWIRALRGVKVFSRLSEQQLDYFRSRGAGELFLLRYIAEFGLTQAESEALL